MLKIVHIAWKDLVVRFRDPSALVLLLVTPFALTLVIAFAFGGLGGDDVDTGLVDIPVVIVNHDDGELGRALAEVFESDELAELVEPVRLQDESMARAMVDADETAAAVVIPPQRVGPRRAGYALVATWLRQSETWLRFDDYRSKGMKGGRDQVTLNRDLVTLGDLSACEGKRRSRPG